MKVDPSHIIDNPELSVLAAFILLDVPSIGGIDSGLFDLASRLTVSVLLLIGLYFMNKMKEASEAKREKALKALLDSNKTSNEAIKQLYEERIADLARQVLYLEKERKDLQDKLINRKETE